MDVDVMNMQIRVLTRRAEQAETRLAQLEVGMESMAGYLRAVMGAQPVPQPQPAANPDPAHPAPQQEPAAEDHASDPAPASADAQIG